MAAIGYPLTRKMLLSDVALILEADGRKTPFKDNMPGITTFDLALVFHKVK